MEIGLNRKTVQLKPHNPEWTNCAKETISVLRKLLGTDAVNIQHVGSTAVAGIPAKPIIDLAIAVQDFSHVMKHKEALAKAGFIFAGEDVERQLLFVVGDFEQDTRSHHIHVVKWNGKEWTNYLNFRDYLNANPSAAREYAALKERLSVMFANDRSAYTQGKQELIDRLLQEAADWRRKMEACE